MPAAFPRFWRSCSEARSPGRRQLAALPARRSCSRCGMGSRAACPYRLLWLVFIYLGAVGSLHLVWDVADTLNGLMAIPNLISVLISIPLIRRLTREFFERREAERTR